MADVRPDAAPLGAAILFQSLGTEDQDLLDLAAQVGTEQDHAQHGSAAEVHASHGASLEDELLMELAMSEPANNTAADAAHAYGEPAANGSQRQQQAGQRPAAMAAIEDDDPFDLDELLEARATQNQGPTTQQQQPPQPQQQQASQKRPAAEPMDYDDLDDLLADMEDMQQHADEDYGPPEEEAEEQLAPAPAAVARAGGAAGRARQADAPCADMPSAKRARGAAPSAAPQAAAGGVAAGQQAFQDRQHQQRVDATITQLFGDDNEEEERQAAEAAAAAAAAAAAEEAARAASRLPRLLASDIQGECLSVTSVSGLRVYCQVQDRTAQPQAVQQAARQQPAAGHAGRRRAGAGASFSLLSKPINEMIREIDNARVQQVLDDSRRLQAQLAAASDEPLLHDMELGADELAAADGQQHQHRAAGDGQLWVNKYAPRGFMQLLSDEATNRDVAKWVKSWDPCVFGTPQQQQAAAGGTGGGMGRATMHSRQGQQQADNRPERKVLLLAGPPGLGKTTLAHVVARHCGYHPYEINASDDRTAATLTARVGDAVQMRPVLGQRRPNCVIIDEIDGATGGAEGHSAIAALIKIVTAGSGGGKGSYGGGADESPEERAAKRGQGGKAGKGGRKGPPPLARPIICICNDLYAPALRPLRDVAQVFHFKPPTADKLVARLQAICTAEGVKADKGALHTLVVRTECDVRTCLNTLQFLAKQQQQQQQAAGRSRRRRASGVGSPRNGPASITLKHIEGLNIGNKDTTKSAFAVWTELLQAQGASRRPRPGASSSGPETAGDHVRRLYGMLSDFGEHELVLAGLHENLHSLRFLDINMRKTSAMMDSIMEAELFISRARHMSEYHLMQYPPACMLMVHLTAAQQERPQVNWPRAQTNAVRRLHTNRELLRSWLGRLSPRVVQAYTRNHLITEIVPALTHVLSPTLRALAPHLLTPAEQAVLAHTVGVMSDMGLNYGMDEDPLPGYRPGARPLLPGQQPQQYRPVPLIPPIDTMHVYGQQQQAASGTVPYAAASPATSIVAPRAVPLVVRQLISQQVTQEGIRRAEAVRLQNDAHAAAAAGASSPGSRARQQQQQQQPKPAAPAAPAPLQAQAKPGAAQQRQAAAPPRKVSWLDNFKAAAARRNNPVAAAAAAGGQEGAAGGQQGKVQFPVLYRFNEGYTNAVKRPLMMRELLG